MGYRSNLGYLDRIVARKIELTFFWPASRFCSFLTSDDTGHVVVLIPLDRKGTPWSSPFCQAYIQTAPRVSVEIWRNIWRGKKGRKIGRKP